MLVLGVHDGTHDAGAALVRDGVLVAAASEERFTRKKGQGGWPSASIAACLQRVGAGIADVDEVAFPGHINPNPGLRIFRSMQSDFRLDDGAFFVEQPGVGDHIGQFLQFDSPFPRWRSEGLVGRGVGFGVRAVLARQAAGMGFRGRTRVFDHHLCHAASAWATCPLADPLVLVADGVGDGLALSVWVHAHGALRQVANMPYPHSYGLLYAVMTGFLGFRPFRHEGKLVGLSARGDASRIRTCFPFSGPVEDRRFTEGFGRRLRPWLAQLQAEMHDGATREDVCAWLQVHLESELRGIASFHLQGQRKGALALAGGVFANVRLNQRLAALAPIWVHPHMGDGGLAAGAALVGAGQTPMATAFLGPECRATGGERVPDVAARMAGVLAAGGTVGRWEGAMEYGPRALGHRSILAPADDPAITERLNHALDRNDFMPFAPMILEDDADRWVDGLENARHAARFMTVTVQARPELARLCPAIVHVDGSLRPQLVGDSTPTLKATLRAYYAQTGRPAIINTSFNLHEEPIVNTEGDALTTGRAAALDLLTFDDRVA